MLRSSWVDSYRDSDLPRSNDVFPASSLGRRTGGPSGKWKSAPGTPRPGNARLQHPSLEAVGTFLRRPRARRKDFWASLDRIGRSLGAERLPGRAVSGGTGESAGGGRRGAEAWTGRLGSMDCRKGLHSSGRRLSDPDQRHRD